MSLLLQLWLSPSCGCHLASQAGLRQQPPMCSPPHSPGRSQTLAQSFLPQHQEGSAEITSARETRREAPACGLVVFCHRYMWCVTRSHRASSSQGFLTGTNLRFPTGNPLPKMQPVKTAFPWGRDECTHFLSCSSHDRSNQTSYETTTMNSSYTIFPSANTQLRPVSASKTRILLKKKERQRKITFQLQKKLQEAQLGCEITARAAAVGQDTTAWGTELGTGPWAAAGMRQGDSLQETSGSFH